MTRIRAIRTELVERKLWPVALVLVIAAIALPIALSGGGDKGTTAVPAAQTSVPANAQPAAVVSVTDVAGGEKRNRKGSVRDPFVQQHVAAPTSETAAAATTTGTPGTNLTPASPLDQNYGGSPGDNPSPTNLSQIAPSTGGNATSVYHAVVRVKQLGKVRWLHDVARYDHVPSDKQRYLLFLGVLSDHKTALFSVMTPAYLYGNARCRPSRKACAMFEMRVGSTELLTLPQADGSVRRVRVTLARIFAKRVRAVSAKAGASSAKHANKAFSASFVK